MKNINRNKISLFLRSTKLIRPLHNFFFLGPYFNGPVNVLLGISSDNIYQNTLINYDKIVFLKIIFGII